MHIEIQVALNFVISYLYNKLPRRRVNLFGEELEKALKERFQGHWYPEKPFKGSAFRCLKTGDPIDAVLDRAARESGVPITDILENLPAELAVWVDPGEVSYRIGEKGAVKILYSESNDHHEESSADREVTKTFNPEAQCFRPIDAVSNNLSALSLSPKTSPHGSPPTSAPSPTFKTTLTTTTSPAPASSFLPRSQAPLTFTTATFAQTKFGSTKLKTSSKRANSRMSPTEFSNYIKQRAMQQQLHHSHGQHSNGVNNGGMGHLGPIGTASPSRSISPNPLVINGGGGGSNVNNGIQDPYYFPNNTGMNMYPPFNGGGSGGGGGVGTGGNGPRNMFDSPHFGPPDNLYGHGLGVGGVTNGTGNLLNGGGSGGGGSGGKYSPYLEPHNFYGMNSTGGSGLSGPHLNGLGNSNGNGGNNIIGNNVGGGGGPLQSTVMGSVIGGGGVGNGGGNNSNMPSSNVIGSGQTNGMNTQQNSVNSPGSNQDNSKLLDGLNSFYSSPGPYQHLLVAN